MGTHTVTILGWHPARLNSWDGCHWAVRRKAKAADRATVTAYCRAAGVPGAGSPTVQGAIDGSGLKKRLVKLTIILGPRMRGGDPDSYWKSLLDALVHAGVLVDDSKEWVELAPVEYRRGKEKATVITLEDLPCLRSAEKRSSDCSNVPAPGKRKRSKT